MKEALSREPIPERLKYKRPRPEYRPIQLSNEEKMRNRMKEEEYYSKEQIERRKKSEEKMRASVSSRRQDQRMEMIQEEIRRLKLEKGDSYFQE